MDARCIRASLDDFHHPRAARYARYGTRSPIGFYEDAFDYPTLWSVLLQPLGPGGDRRYRRAMFDVVADAPLAEAWQLAADNAILIFDGIFALRPDLLAVWDYRIFVQIPLEMSLERALLRDLALHGSAERSTRELHETLHAGAGTLPGDDATDGCADAVVENEDPARPVLPISRANSLRQREPFGWHGVLYATGCTVNGGVAISNRLRRVIAVVTFALLMAVCARDTQLT